jgi:hypothetical protein
MKKYKHLTTQNNKMNLSILLFCCTIILVKGSKYRVYQKTNGFDHRPNIPESPLQLQRIVKHFENKRLLNALENPQISLHVKTRMVEDRDIKPPNIYAGGLMRDFLFDIEDPNSTTFPDAKQ